jgi:hypothetical protein
MKTTSKGQILIYKPFRSKSLWSLFGHMQNSNIIVMVNLYELVEGASGRDWHPPFEKITCYIASNRDDREKGLPEGDHQLYLW